MPYLDFIIEEIDKNNDFIKRAFGDNLHFGYWDSKIDTDISLEDYLNATRRMNEVCLSNFDITSEKVSILDVGCGFGGTLRWLDEHVRNSNLYGINIDARQINKAINQSKFMSRNNNKLDFKVASAMKLPFLDETCDLVFSLECMSHFSSRELFLKEAFRVLKPGGLLIVSDWLMDFSSIISNFIIFITNLRKSQKLYGRRTLPFNKVKYLSVATAVGFKEVEFIDINDNTLPTFVFFKSAAHYLNSAEKIFREGNEFSQLVCSRGLSRYNIISFRK